MLYYIINQNYYFPGNHVFKITNFSMNSSYFYMHVLTVWQLKVNAIFNMYILYICMYAYLQLKLWSRYWHQIAGE